MLNAPQRQSMRFNEVDQRDRIKVHLTPRMRRQTKWNIDQSNRYHWLGIQHRKPTIRSRRYKPCRTNEEVWKHGSCCKRRSQPHVTNQTPLIHLYGQHPRSHQARSHPFSSRPNKQPIAKTAPECPERWENQEYKPSSGRVHRDGSMGYRGLWVPLHHRLLIYIHVEGTDRSCCSRNKDQTTP